MHSSSTHFTRRGALAVAGAAAAAIVLDACSSSGSSSPSSAAPSTAVGQSEVDQAMKTPTTLTFWTWVPDISQEVAVFEKQYPAIKINVVNPGQGTPLYTKLRTALDAGKGTPDVAQVEYQYLPTFAILNAFVDLRPYGAAANAGMFVDWVWQQVTGPSGEIYAYPQDTGPMGMLYGPDFGPAAQLAAKLHTSAPDFLGNTLMLPSIANVVTWEFTGYNMIVLYAALRTVPRELYDAAAVDGAGAWRIAWSIKVPALRPALLLCLMFSIIGSFQLFTEPNLLQAVAPTVIGASYTPNLYAYSLAFVSQEPDYAAAVSFLLGLAMVIISYAVLYAASRRSRL